MNKPNEQITVTKAQIVDDVYRELNKDKDRPLMTRKASADLVDQVFQLIKDEINGLKEQLDACSPEELVAKPERRLKISGFGNFVVRYKRSRPGRNPQNGEKIKISSRYVLTFKPSQVLKKAINNPGGPEAMKVHSSVAEL
jgi:integration host factor subunit alpha